MVDRDGIYKCKKITNIKRFHVTIFGQQTYLLSQSSLTMANRKMGLKFTTAVYAIAAAVFVVTSTAPLPLTAIVAALPRLLLP
jgi:hypothetical protein